MFSQKQMEVLARVGPNGEYVATLSVSLYKYLLKLKDNCLVCKDNNSLNSDLFKPSTISFWSSVQMLMVSSSGMLVKREHLSYP